MYIDNQLKRDFVYGKRSKVKGFFPSVCGSGQPRASLRGTKQSPNYADHGSKKIYLSILPHGISARRMRLYYDEQLSQCALCWVTSDLTGRVWDHKNKTYPKSFTAKYNCDKLVYYEFYPRIEEAIAVEKVLKGGNKKNKIKLINSINPNWLDLYDDLIKE